MQKPVLIGFYINRTIYFDMNMHRLFELHGDKKNKSFMLRLEVLNETSSRLLASMLKYSYNNMMISKNILMDVIWGTDLTKSSTQRLWQLLNELKNKLETFGIERHSLFVDKGRYSFTLSNIEPVFTASGLDDLDI